MSWSDLYEAESGVVGVVPGGTYVVRVDAVRTRPQSRLLFIDLLIEAGPLAGKVAQVTLYVPRAGDRNAGFHFRKKVAGFGDLRDTYVQMSAVDPDGSNIEGALDIRAMALVGRRVLAEIDLRTDGDYAGTNELIATRATEAAR